MKKATVGILRRACSLMVLVAAATVGVAQTPPPAANPPPATAPGADPAPAYTPDEISYAFGLIFGTQLHGASITTEVVPESITRGIRDALQGKQPSPADQQQIQAFVRSVGAAVAARNQTAAKDFLARNGQEKGVVTTASGLQYKILAAGDKKAPPIAAGDTVTADYRGKLLDGSEFDSSYSRGVPQVFPVNGVIKGWQEALAMMKPGAKWQLFIPPELAYGARAQAKVPANSLLIFELNVLSAESSSAQPKSPPGTPPKAPPGTPRTVPPVKQ
jgi:FKBP-type peptidyl-prolyl cis-trans isomerase FklB